MSELAGILIRYQREYWSGSLFFFLRFLFNRLYVALGGRASKMVYFLSVLKDSNSTRIYIYTSYITYMHTYVRTYIHTLHIYIHTYIRMHVFMYVHNILYTRHT